MPWLLQEIARGIGAVDLEALMRAAVLMRQPHVVEHGARIEQFRIELQAAMLPRERTEIIDAARMVEEERRLCIPHELRHFARQFAVGDGHPADGRIHLVGSFGRRGGRISATA